MKTEEIVQNQETVVTRSGSSWYDIQNSAETKALLVGVYASPSALPLAIEHLSELAQLADTHNIPVAGQLPMLIRQFSARTFISKGKVDSLRAKMQEVGAKIVIFDDEISPVQQKNLEEELRAPVMDRTEVILGVFASRAKTHEAKLQVELAQLRYVAPRLKRMWTHLSRQSGGGGGASGGGYLKGEGEKQIEIDRRILKQRVERLQSELKEITHYRHTQRALRERNQIPVFAIVGYTNAGKSTLMKLLTKADVLVEDKLFATLDTTTRHCTLPNNQEVLFVDTVGFIRKLPHLLVAAFKSTLEEAVQADFLIHLIDGSHPQALDQAATTLEVLKELHAEDCPIITVINKIDMVDSDSPLIHKLKMEYPKAILLSATKEIGLEALFDSMIELLHSRRKRVRLEIPQSEYGLVATAIRLGTVYEQSYDDENNVCIDVELPIASAERLKKYEKTKR